MGIEPAIDITAEQRKVPLDDVIDLVLSSVDKKTKDNERAVQLCNYTDVYYNSFIHASLDFMTATATDREIAKCSLFSGDVVITKDSEKYDDIGVPALVREDIPGLVCGYHLAILRPMPSKIEGNYLFYALCTSGVQHQFHSYANGVTRFGLRKADIGLVEIPLPPLPEQRAIAHILGTLDDKIELNRRMNETLEEMARALFKSWFVDFDPVRAKMEGRDTGLPPDVADLFPDRLVESELGEIPEGWEVKALGECIDVARGLSYKGTGLSSDGMPMHNLNSIYEGGGYKDDGIKYYNGDYHLRHVIQPGEVIVANTEQGHDRLLIGFAAIVPKCFGDNGLFSHHIYRVRPKDSLALASDFICQLLNTKAMHNTVSGYATGTTVNMLPVDALRSRLKTLFFLFDPFEQQVDHGDLNEGFAMVGQHLIISRMAAKIHQPRKGALDDPTAGYDLKAGPLVGDDFQVYFVRLFYFGYPRSDRLTLIAAIDPQFA